MVQAEPMHWHRVKRVDGRARALAERHYSRQSPGAREFTPPGRTFVLLTADGRAAWASAWPYPQFVQRMLPGAWVNVFFRNEGPLLSSLLIRQAVAATLAYWGTAPAEGMVTMIDKRAVRPKKHFGYCYRRAGFTEAGRTKGGLLVLQLLPDVMPPPQPALGTQLALEWEAQR
jgi:hypothetical protein